MAEVAGSRPITMASPQGWSLSPSILPLIPTNVYTPTTSRDTMSKQDSTLQLAPCWSLSTYAESHFVRYRRGFMRRQASPDEMVSWSKKSLRQPLTKLDSTKFKNIQSDAIACFKRIQRAMEERALATNSTRLEAMQYLLEKGLMIPPLRNELYCQICKQLTKPRDATHREYGWEVLSLFCWMFPSVKDLTQHVRGFLLAHSSADEPNERIRTIAKYAQKKLAKVCETGARPRVPTIAEIERALEAPFKPSVFGSSLEDIMIRQKERKIPFPLPEILVALTQHIVHLKGEKTEGIFRVAGDVDAVCALRLKIEQEDYNLCCDDPNVPASLLKIWLRELEEPLIPSRYYDRCLASTADVDKVLSLIEELPQINQAVIRFLSLFLRRLAKPEHQEFTKMSLDNFAMVFAPSFLRCPHDDPHLIFENARFEQQFARIVLEHCE